MLASPEKESSHFQVLEAPYQSTIEMEAPQVNPDILLKDLEEDSHLKVNYKRF